MMCELTVGDVSFFFCCCCLSLAAVNSAQSLMKRVGYQGGKLASIVSSLFFFRRLFFIFFTFGRFSPLLCIQYSFASFLWLVSFQEPSLSRGFLDLISVGAKADPGGS